MDTAALEAGYRRLLTTAGAGGFKAPADASAWSAELVLAHVAVNDRLLAAATVEVLAGGKPRYDNAPSTRADYLSDVGRAAGSWASLLATVRQGGLELVWLARRLDDTHLAAPVPTRILDGDVTRVEAELPWASVLRTHADVHLPAHTEQLAALR
jgi:hypothetical protein